MKKIVTLVMTLLMLVSMTGCGFSSNKVDVNELKKNSGTMFETQYYSPTFFKPDEEAFIGITYNFNYNGTLEMTKHYNISGDYSATVTVSDEDYKAIYECAVAAKKLGDKNTFGEYMLDGGGDGSWQFTYFEPNASTGDLLFSGYFASGHKYLDTFRDTCKKYSDGAEFVNANGEEAPM